MWKETYIIHEYWILWLKFETFFLIRSCVLWITYKIVIGSYLILTYIMIVSISYECEKNVIRFVNRMYIE